MSGPRKIFQIGFQRCGTTAITRFFQRNGVAAIHYDGGRLGRRMARNLADGLPLISGYERYTVFTNMEYSERDHWFEGFRYWRALMTTYEDSRFILNIRDRERWCRSLFALGHANPDVMLPYFRARYGTAKFETLAEIWRCDWDSHHRDVIAGIPPERLLVFNIEKDPPTLLARFAGLPDQAAAVWTMENPTLTPAVAAVVRRVPRSIKRAVPDWIKLPVKRRFGVR